MPVATTDEVGAKLGVKISETSIVFPAASVVVYSYGVGSPTEPVVAAGAPTTTWVVVGSAGVVDVVRGVVDVVVVGATRGSVVVVLVEVASSGSMVELEGKPGQRES